MYSDELRVGRPRDRGSIFGGSKRIFSFPRRPDRLWEPIQPSTQWVPGNLSPRVKRPGRESDHSPPSSAKVKNSEPILHSPMCYYRLEPWFRLPNIRIWRRVLVMTLLHIEIFPVKFSLLSPKFLSTTNCSIRTVKLLVTRSRLVAEVPLRMWAVNRADVGTCSTYVHAKQYTLDCCINILRPCMLAEAWHTFMKHCFKRKWIIRFT
jgi:hypothetical protein